MYTPVHCERALGSARSEVLHAGCVYAECDPSSFAAASKKPKAGLLWLFQREREQPRCPCLVYSGLRKTEEYEERLSSFVSKRDSRILGDECAFELLEYLENPRLRSRVSQLRASNGPGTSNILAKHCGRIICVCIIYIGSVVPLGNVARNKKGKGYSATARCERRLYRRFHADLFADSRHRRMRCEVEKCKG